MIKKQIKIKLASGMLIGSGNDDFKLGGVNSKTITKSIDDKDVPYIPASSLKGKLRYLAESAPNENKVNIDKYYGKRGSSEQNSKDYFNRILFCDLHVVEDTNIATYFEIKTENTIKEENQKMKANPRTNERTVEGLTFVGIVILPDNEAEKMLKRHLGLLESFYIGGQGSRGYGWIESAELCEV